MSLILVKVYTDLLLREQGPCFLFIHGHSNLVLLMVQGFNWDKKYPVNAMASDAPELPIQDKHEIHFQRPVNTTS